MLAALARLDVDDDVIAVLLGADVDLVGGGLVAGRASR